MLVTASLSFDDFWLDYMKQNIIKLRKLQV